MKNYFYVILSMLFLFSCTDEDSKSLSENNTNETTVENKRVCATDEVFNQQLKEDPSLHLRMNEIEMHAKNFSLKQAKLINGEIVIPVVVNVLYKENSENISDEQIKSQIDVLNKDFNARNTDIVEVPAMFKNLVANVGIKFQLDKINRKKVRLSSWGTFDLMKTSIGIRATSPKTKLNIWVCTIGFDTAGYAQFPGGLSFTDGVVIDSRYFGTVGTATYPYNLGRTTTHEVGHWMNLRHIWGDRTCGTDYVADTPSHDSPNYGAPVFPHYSKCFGNEIEMTMNYMDYTDDRALNMFTEGQKVRMLSVFSHGGARRGFVR